MNLKEILLDLNEENITKLYNNYKDTIFLFVLNITKNYHMSEDITEEVFMRVLKYHDTYDRLKNPKTWIFTIAKNTTYSYLKKNKEASLEDEKLEFLLNKHNTIKNEDSLLIEEYLVHLNDIERNIIILHVFGGLTHLEISKILDMKYSLVRARYNYALKKLRKKLKGENRQYDKQTTEKKDKEQYSYRI